MNVERWRFFGGEGAQPFPGASSTFELNIRRNDVDQVDLVLNGFYRVLFDAGQGWPRFARSESESEGESW